jgi:hypothetical protein
VVRPGVWNRKRFWDDYTEADEGRTIVLGWRGRKRRFRAPHVSTVGDWFGSDVAVATAVSLGVNRPHFVEAALWSALNGAPAHDRVGDLLDRGRAGEAELRALLWPEPPLLPSDERTLLDRFRRAAIGLYRPSDQERRARRLATAELLP